MLFTSNVLILVLLLSLRPSLVASACALTSFILIDTHPLSLGGNSTMIGEMLPNEAQILCLPTDSQIQIQVIYESCANVIMKLKPGAAFPFWGDYKYEHEFPFKLYHIPDNVEDVGRTFQLGVNYTITAIPEFRRRKAITSYFYFNATCNNNNNKKNNGDGRLFLRRRRRRIVTN